LTGTVPEGEVVVTREAFRKNCPPLYHEKHRLDG
jgi:hypothetical protein